MIAALTRLGPPVQARPGSLSPRPWTYVDDVHAFPEPGKVMELQVYTGAAGTLHFGLFSPVVDIPCFLHLHRAITVPNVTTGSNTVRLQV
jgi:hypothetical protein